MIRMKIIIFLILLLLNNCIYAAIYIKKYKNCTGIKFSKKLFNHNFIEYDSYQKNGYHYSIVMGGLNDNVDICLIINNNRKVIVDIVPAIVKGSCNGQWDQSSNKPVWMNDIGGGKDGVENIYYLPDDQLKRLNYKHTDKILEIIDHIYCQLPFYRKEDVRELNDAAYFLARLGYRKEAIFLINKVIVLDPERVVAYLNLGDIYWFDKNRIQAKKNYSIYIKKMEKKGLKEKIPKHIYEFLEN